MALEDDIARIDVDLNLIDSDTVRGFTEEMSRLHTLIASIKSGAPGETLATSGDTFTSRGTAADARVSSKSQGASSSAPSSMEESIAQALESQGGVFGKGPLHRNTAAWRWAAGPSQQADPNAELDRELGIPTPPGGRSPGASGGGGLDTSRSFWENRLLADGGTALRDPITMPRFGEFTLQDSLNMLSNGLGGAAGMLTGAASRGGLAGGAANALRGTLGTAAGALDIAQQYSPYMSMVEQQVGMPLHNPLAMGAVGREMGYEGGADITIPGTDVGFQVGSGMIPAYERALDNIMAGLKPGVSTQEMKAWDAAMDDATGTSDHPDSPYHKLRERLKEVRAEDLRGKQLPNEQLMAETAQQMFRYNSDEASFASIEDFTQLMGNVGATARSVGMDLDDFQSQIMAVGDALQEKGLTYNRGIQAAERFSYSTGLAPQIGPALMENPMVQMNVMDKTGLLPQQQGLAFENPALFNTSVLDAIRQSRNIFKGTQTDQTYTFRGQEYTTSGQEAELAMVAQQMGLPVDAVTDLWKNRKEVSAESDISGRLALWEKTREKIHTKTGGEGEDFEDAMADLREGRGKYAGKDMATTDEIYDQLKKYDDKGTLKIKDEQWDYIDEEAEKGEGARQKAIEKVMRSHSREKETPEVGVKFTGFAEKVLKEAFREKGIDWKTKNDEAKGRSATNERGTGTDLFSNKGLTDAPASVLSEMSGPELIEYAEARENLSNLDELLSE